ncbi:MAG: phosphatase PAP2 family protein [Gemmataceae bacterium]
MSVESAALENTVTLEATWRRVLRQGIILAIIMFSALGCYLIVLKWRGDAAQYITWTPWDELIPFQPAWVWVYLLPYGIAPIVIGFLTPATFWWFIRRGLVVIVITIAIFIVLPTQTATRPAHTLSPGLTAWMYEEMVKIDEPPANAAPSLHVSLTCLLALALLCDFPRYWPLSVGCVLLVWAATLFTRQHHLIDVATGASLAVAVSLIMGWRRA